MQPENVNSTLVTGENFEYDLFQAAISWAENGFVVWFISPKVIEKLPKNLKPPDKEVLQLITFMYLKDHNDLMKQLNGIHLWRKAPSLIIISGFEHYTSLSSAYDPHLTSLVATTLLDSAAVCAHKNKNKINLLVTCSANDEDIEKLQVVKDLYFLNYVHKTDDNFTQTIIELLNRN